MIDEIVDIDTCDAVLYIVAKIVIFHDVLEVEHLVIIVIIQFLEQEVATCSAAY